MLIKRKITEFRKIGLGFMDFLKILLVNHQPDPFRTRSYSNPSVRRAIGEPTQISTLSYSNPSVNHTNNPSVNQPSLVPGTLSYSNPSINQTYNPIVYPGKYWELQQSINKAC